MELYFQKIGKGPAFIILHGLYGMSDNWMSFARQLSKEFTVYLIDQRNHGRSPHDKDHSYHAMSSDLSTLFNNEDIDKAIILGHSMGGKTAMVFTLLNPEKVESLIVVDIAPVNYSSVDTYNSQIILHLNIINTMLSVDFTKILTRAEIDDELGKTITDIHIRQFILKNIERKQDGTYGWKLNIDAISKALPGIMNFPKKEVSTNLNLVLKLPVLFIKGADSQYIIPEYNAEINYFFPDAEIVTIPNAGHWVHVDQPQLFLNNIKAFIGN